MGAFLIKQRALILSAGALALGAALIFTLALRPAAAGSGAAVPFRVGAATGVRAIAAELEARGLIRSRGAFALWSFLMGAAHRLQPGTYLLSRASSTPAIVAALRAGAPPESVLIVEGATLREIDAAFAERGVTEPSEILTFPAERLAAEFPFLADAPSLEGFLFPDTYRLSVGSSPEAVLRLMLENFAARAAPLLTDAADPYETLTIASLIEKEVAGERERGIVSGIIRKRLTLGMPLQVDATVVYAKCATFAGCAPLAKSDFTNPSPYNTYERQGLPPGPIGNPGLAAIRAAINPAPSPYLYYLSDPRTDRTVFAETFEEHNENRAKYLGL